MESKGDTPASAERGGNDAPETRDSVPLRPALTPAIRVGAPVAMSVCTALGLLAGFALGGVYYYRPAPAMSAPVCAESPPCGKWSLQNLRAEPWHHDFHNPRRLRHEEARRAIEAEEVEVDEAVDEAVDRDAETPNSEPPATP